MFAGILHKLKLASGVQQNLTLKNVTKNVTKNATALFGALNTFKNSLLQGNSAASMLSDKSAENLASLSEDLMSSYSDSNNDHLQLLKDLWNILFNSSNDFQRQGVKWKEAGFVSLDPTTDLKKSGILALSGMTYLCKQYPSQAQEMLSNNKENVKTKYPFAIVGNNQSCVQLNSLMFYYMFILCRCECNFTVI